MIKVIEAFKEAIKDLDQPTQTQLLLLVLDIYSYAYVVGHDEGVRYGS